MTDTRTPPRLNAHGLATRLIGATALCAAMLTLGNARAQEIKAVDPAPVPDAADDMTVSADESEDWLPGEISGHVALTSNYVDRGFTSSSNDPAIQGSLDYAFDTGVLGTQGYVGMWSSSVNIEGDTSTAHVEIDALFGLRGEIGDLAWDIGGAYYVYPGTRNNDNFDYWEIPLVLDYAVTDRVNLELVNLFAWDNQFDTGLANYTTAIASYDIASKYVDFQLFGGVGYQYVEQDYNGVDWRLGATATIKGVDFTVAYTDTNYRASECGNNQCNAKVIFTVGAAF